MADLRLATFNVENLFSRPKLLSFNRQEKGDEELKKVAQLQKELNRAKYDEAAIVKLVGELKSFITIIEVRDRLFTNASRNKLKAKSEADWDGWLELKREKITEAAQKNTAKVIKDVEAQIQCIIEVDDRPTLGEFCAQTLKGEAKFPFWMCVDGNDDRGIDVGFTSKVPFDVMRSHAYDRDDQGEVFSRDCLEVQFPLAGGKELWLLINHFKSKGFSGAEQGNAKRKRQAVQVAKILKRYDLKKQFVAVVGDLNDTPDSDPLSPLLGVKDLHDVLEVKFPNAADRWTYNYRNKNQQIDYLLVSTALKDEMRDAGVFRRGIHDVDKFSTNGETPYPSIKLPKDSASDHGAVWADFKI